MGYCGRSNDFTKLPKNIICYMKLTFLDSALLGLHSIEFYRIKCNVIK